MTTLPSTPLVAVALSGGVDSAVAAALLLEQGYPVVGVTMRLFQHEQHLHDAQRVAEHLGIPLHVYDFRSVFERRIIRYFCDEYAAGRTPNPCVFCNPELKFGLLFDQAHRVGAQKLATGHYVNVEYEPQAQRYILKTAATEVKDQSYFLYRLTQAQLARSLFPLAGLTKAEIRTRASDLGLHTVAAKAESQENCFVLDQSTQQFLAAHLPSEAHRPGPIVDRAGNVLGQHQGIYRYTIGQRRGLGIALGTPRYVLAIEPATNTIVIGEEADLLRQEFRVTQLNLIAGDRWSTPLEVAVKIRYRNSPTPARVLAGRHADELRVRLATPQRAITPGQSAVFYQGRTVLGGGVIQENA
jgi:tRNA-uridine 2-sulfurtransferase